MMRGLKEARSRMERRLLRIPVFQLASRVVRELGADDAAHMAAGVAYYVILSLFPLLLGLIAVLGFILPSQDVQQELLGFFQRNLPGSTDVVEENIEQVIQLRGAAGSLSLIGLFWSASAMFGALSRSINRAWDVHRDRPFFLRKARELGMALGTGVLFLLSLGANTVLADLGGLDLPFFGPVVNVAGVILAFGLNLAIFLLTYKFIPNTRTYWRYIWPGAVLAAVLFHAGQSLFVLYLGMFASYDRVYGSLGSVIALLVWIYVSAFILILGAEVSSEYGRMRRNVERGATVPLRTGTNSRTDGPA